jgi:hypothetical protein
MKASQSQSTQHQHVGTLIDGLVIYHRDQIACMAIVLRNESAKSSYEASQGFEALTAIYCVHTRGSPSPGVRLRVCSLSSSLGMQISMCVPYMIRTTTCTGKIFLSFFVLPFLTPTNPIKE